MNLNQHKTRMSSLPNSKHCTSMYNSKQPTNNLQQIITTSPLKVPLNHAISKLVSTMHNITTANSRIKYSHASSISTVYHSKEQSDQYILKIIHSEVFEFLQKYFGGRNTSEIWMGQFIEGLVEQYIGPINDQDLLDLLSKELKRLVGYEYMVLGRLDQVTKGKGLSGLMMDICSTIKESQVQEEYQISRLCTQEDNTITSPQINNLKNVLTQFFESMAKSMENQIYAKFNKQMRKLIMKYNETEQLLKQVNERITYNIDKIKHIDRRKERISLEQKIQQDKQKIRLLIQDNKKGQIKHSLVYAENLKLIEYNKSLLTKIHTLQQQLKLISKQLSSKQYGISTTSTTKNQPIDLHQQPFLISNFMLPQGSRIVSLSPIKRPSSSTSNRNPYEFKQPRREQSIGINLTTKTGTPKQQSRRNSKQSNMIYFA